MIAIDMRGFRRQVEQSLRSPNSADPRRLPGPST
jgi:hypothetical protein